MSPRYFFNIRNIPDRTIVCHAGAVSALVGLRKRQWVRAAWRDVDEFSGVTGRRFQKVSSRRGARPGARETHHEIGGLAHT
jgi:hypothetical protein